jgi:hypothetical protein
VLASSGICISWHQVSGTGELELAPPCVGAGLPALCLAPRSPSAGKPAPTRKSRGPPRRAAHGGCAAQEFAPPVKRLVAQGTPATLRDAGTPAPDGACAPCETFSTQLANPSQTQPPQNARDGVDTPRPAKVLGPGILPRRRPAATPTGQSAPGFPAGRIISGTTIPVIPAGCRNPAPWTAALGYSGGGRCTRPFSRRGADGRLALPGTGSRHPAGTTACGNSDRSVRAWLPGRNYDQGRSKINWSFSLLLANPQPTHCHPNVRDGVHTPSRQGARPRTWGWARAIRPESDSRSGFSPTAGPWVAGKRRAGGTPAVPVPRSFSFPSPGEWARMPGSRPS